MISWIQTSLQRHFRVVFFVLLAVLIVSFVFTIGAAPGIGTADRQIQARTFFDLNLSSPEDQQKLLGDASLSIALQAGFQNIPDAQLQEFAFQRYASLYLANQVNMPGPSENQLKDFIKEVRAFTGPTGEFDASRYASFRDNLKLMGQFTEADVDRVLRDDYRLREVQKLLGGPGYVVDAEVQSQLARTDTVWSTNLLRLNYETFAPSIEPSEDELQTYFDENAFRYETAPQVKVSYIEFPSTRYLAQVNPTEDEIRAHYEANPARFPRADSAAEGETPAISESDPDIDFLAVRDRVAAALRFERARRVASEAASDMAVALFDASPAPEQLATFVAEKGEILRASAPFDRASPPSFLNTAPQHVQAAFQLNEDDRISDPLPTAAGAVILVWEEFIPSAPSPYATVADQVREDYVEAQKRQQFVELGRSVRESLAAQLATGSTFEDAVASLENLQGATTSVETFADFTRISPPENFPQSTAASFENLQEGDVSEMVLMTNEGLITHAAKRTPPSLGPTDERFVELKTQLAELNSASTASATMRALIEGQFDQAETALQ
ncbi:MAG: peptidylprolyl isomerase [Synoicihabitans sp.]